MKIDDHDDHDDHDAGDVAPHVVIAAPGKAQEFAVYICTHICMYIYICTVYDHRL